MSWCVTVTPKMCCTTTTTTTNPRESDKRQTKGRETRTQEGNVGRLLRTGGRAAQGQKHRRRNSRHARTHVRASVRLDTRHPINKNKHTAGLAPLVEGLLLCEARSKHNIDNNNYYYDDDDDAQRYRTVTDGAVTGGTVSAPCRRTA